MKSSFHCHGRRRARPGSRRVRDDCQRTGLLVPPRPQGGSRGAAVPAAQLLPAPRLSPASLPLASGQGRQPTTLALEGPWDTLPARKPLISRNGRPGTGLWPRGDGFGHPGKGELQSQAAARERRAARPGPLRPVAPTRRAGPHRAAPLSGDALSCQGLRPAYADSGPHCPSPQTSATTSPVTRGSRCLPTPGGGPSSSASESRWAWAQPGWRREDGALRPGTLPPPRRGTRAR